MATILFSLVCIFVIRHSIAYIISYIILYVDDIQIMASIPTQLQHGSTHGMADNQRIHP